MMKLPYSNHHHASPVFASSTRSTSSSSSSSYVRCTLPLLYVLVAVLASVSINTSVRLARIVTTSNENTKHEQELLQHHLISSQAEKAPSSYSNEASTRTAGGINAKNKNDKSRSSTGVSSCLLIMDDNHWLVEWLAYHWTVLNLDYVVVAVDGRSRTSPVGILDRWDGKIGYELWNDEHFNFGVHKKKMNLQEINLERQKAFLPACMRTLKARNKTLAIFTDTDEFIAVNPRAGRPKNKWLYRPHHNELVTSSASARRGYVLDFIEEERRQRPESSKCFSMGRMQFSPDEASAVDVQRQVPPFLNGSDFLTLRWMHVADDLVGPKNIVDLSKVTWDQMPLRRTHQHRVIPEVCGEAGHAWDRHNSLLQVYHYLGSERQFSFRDDARLSLKSAGRNSRFQRYAGKGDPKLTDDLRPWLKAFVEAVGEVEAKRLLDGVGVVDGWEGASSHKNRFAPIPVAEALIAEGGHSDGSKINLEPISSGEDGRNDNGEDGQGTSSESFDDGDENDDDENSADDNENGEGAEALDEHSSDYGDENDDDENSGDEEDDDEDGKDDDEIGGGGEEESVDEDAADDDKSFGSLDDDAAAVEDNADEQETRKSRPVIYSVARTDRSGAAVADMLLAHAYAYSQNATYGGACPRETLLHRNNTEMLIEGIGLQDLLVYACPDDEDTSPVLDRPAYASKNTKLFTSAYLTYLRSLVRYPAEKKAGAGEDSAAVQIAVHIRRGDVSPCSRYANRYLPNSHYLGILKEHVPEFIDSKSPNASVTIFSESDAFERWEDFRDCCSLHLDTDLVDAWKSMMVADYVVLSKSSFSFVPAMLNTHGKVIYTTFMQRKLPSWTTVKDSIMEDTKKRVLEMIHEKCHGKQKEDALYAMS